MRLEADSPKIFHALGRFLAPEALEEVATYYQQAARLGGNIEPKQKREQGVSFNPRIARVLSILIHDCSVTDLLTIKSAIRASVMEQGVELREVSASLEALEPLSEQRMALVRGALALDTVRHLHQCRYSSDETSQILARAERLLETLEGEALALKLRHAIGLQRRVLG